MDWFVYFGNAETGSISTNLSFLRDSTIFKKKKKKNFFRCYICISKIACASAQSGRRTISITSHELHFGETSHIMDDEEEDEEDVEMEEEESSESSDEGGEESDDDDDFELVSKPEKKPTRTISVNVQK